jgi:hypothetical protein
MAEATFTLTQADVLSPANATRDDDPPERGDVRASLLNLDRDIPDAPHTSVLGRNVHRHWNDQFLTCLWYPHQSNNFKVNEIYLRYGKSRAEMDAQDRQLGLPRLEGDSPDFGSFAAHVHISIGVGHFGFFYQIVIGPRGWPDHNVMMTLWRQPSAGDRLLEQFRSLEESSYVLFFGEEAFRGLDRFQSAAELARELSRFDHLRGQEWFGIRKEIEISDRVAVSSERLIQEIQRMYPAFGDHQTTRCWSLNCTAAPFQGSRGFRRRFAHTADGQLGIIKAAHVGMAEAPDLSRRALQVTQMGQPDSTRRA